MTRTTRDMHPTQFARALRIHGFAKMPLDPFGCYFGHAEFPNTHFAGVLSVVTGKLLRRETMHRLLRDLERARAKARERAS